MGFSVPEKVEKSVKSVPAGMKAISLSESPSKS